MYSRPSSPSQFVTNSFFDQLAAIAFMGIFEKTCTVLIATSLIVLSVAADWMVQNGLRQDMVVARANAITVDYKPQR